MAAVVIAAVLAQLLKAHGVNAYSQSLIANCGIAVVLAVSLTVVNGFTGQFSIGHSGFMAIGGYAAASLAYYGTFYFFHDVNFHGGSLSFSGKPADLPAHWIGRGDWLFIAALVFGAIVSAGVGWVVGLPSLRLRGDYLAIVTLGFCEIVRILLQQTPEQLGIAPTDPDEIETGIRYLGDGSLPGQMGHLGGALGFGQVPTYATVFWIVVAALVTIGYTIRLKYSSYGRAMLSIREDDIAASAVGVNVTRMKVRAFVFSAFFAGLAGGLFALRNGTISAGELGFQRSFDFVIMVVLGGMGSISGATIAAIFLTMLPEWLRDPAAFYPWDPTAKQLAVAAGIIAAVVLVFSRRRVVGLLTVIGACVVWQAIVSGFTFVQSHGHPTVRPSDYRLVLYSLLLISVMIFRPQGLLGVYEIWDVWPKRRRGERISSLRSHADPLSPALPLSPSLSPGLLPLLDVRDISITFGGLKAVQNLSVAVLPGGLSGLIGPNGAGKTTAFNLLTGVYRPTTGSVLVDSVRVDGRKSFRIVHAGLARTFQNIRLFGELSVLDNVRLGAQMRHPTNLWSCLLRTGRRVLSERQIEATAYDLLGTFGLAQRAHDQAKNLPYGDQRRLEIARALATGPKVLLLDEPAAGMNPQEKLELMELIRFVRDRFSVAVLLIEHDMKLVMGICQSITVLDHGEMIATGTPPEIRANPKVIQAYLGEDEEEEGGRGGEGEKNPQSDRRL